MKCETIAVCNGEVVEKSVENVQIKRVLTLLLSGVLFLFSLRLHDGSFSRQGSQGAGVYPSRLGPLAQYTLDNDHRTNTDRYS